MKFYSISEEQMQRRGIARTGLRLCTCHPEKEKKIFPEIFATATVGVADINNEMEMHPERFEKRDGGIYRKQEKD